jgi:hypothetical protein
MAQTLFVEGRRKTVDAFARYLTSRASSRVTSNRLPTQRLRSFYH